jgi:hypothetical protein
VLEGAAEDGAPSPPPAPAAFGAAAHTEEDADAGGAADADDKEEATARIRGARRKESKSLSEHLRTCLNALETFREQHPTAHIFVHMRQFTGKLGSFLGECTHSAAHMCVCICGSTVLSALHCATQQAGGGF